jgi:hypothetical protein
MKKLINVQRIKYSALSAALVLSTIMLSTSIDEDNLIFAQMLNSSENFSFTIPLEELTTGQTSPNNDGSNDAFTDSSGSSIDNDASGTVEKEFETITSEEQSDSSENSVEHVDTTSDEQDNTVGSEEQDNKVTNPFLEQIRNKVDEALSGVTSK